MHTARGDVKAPVVGRICMDQCMIDVTDTGARTGDVITLFGDTPNDVTAYAARASTINYESLCLISSRVMRRYLPADPLQNTERTFPKT